MKKLLGVVLILVLAVPLYAEIRLGALFAVTGPASFLGLPEKQTLEMLVEEVNKEGGIAGENVKLFLYDTKGLDSEARKKFIRLVKKDKVDAVIGPTRSGSTLAIKELAERYKTPLLSCAASKRIVQPLNKYVFKSPQSDTHAVGKIYNFLRKKGKSKVAIITAQNGFGDSGRTELLELADEYGMKIVADEKFRDTDKDMTSQLTKISEANPDAIICWGVGPAPALVAKNARQLGLDSMLIMSHGVASKKFIGLAGEAAEGIILPAGRLLVADRLDKDSKYRSVLLKYKETYEKRYDSSVSTFGGHAYDAFMMFKYGIEKGGKEADKMISAIESRGPFIGTAGEFNITATDHNGLDKSAFVMLKIHNGDWELIN